MSAPARRSAAAMRMRQSLAQFEAEFHEQTREDHVRGERLRRKAADRARTRRAQRARRAGNLRFAGLVAAIVLTAVVVTVAMFETLALVFG